MLYQGVGEGRGVGGGGRVRTCVCGSLKCFNGPFPEEALLVLNPSPLQTLFPVIKMFPKLRYIWKVLENPTGRRRGQKELLSHAVQEALHRIFALRDSQLRSLTPPAREPLHIDERSTLGTWVIKNLSRVSHKPFIKREHLGPISVYVTETGLVPGDSRERFHFWN